MKHASFKRASTLFLKAVLLLIAVIVVAVCIFGLPAMWKGGSEEFPMASNAALLIMIGLYVTAAFLFIALWQTFKLLQYIDRNAAFSDASVKALKNIKQCATVIAVFYVGGVPLLYPIADADDAPGLLIIGMIVACAPVAVAVFAAILQRLLQSAIAMKNENDLTV